METYFDQQEVLTPSVLQLFETDKHQRKLFVDSLLERLDNGEISPLQAHLQLKAMEDIITQLTNSDKQKNKNLEANARYKSYLFDAFKSNCNGQKSFDFHNAKFTQMETGSKWHYENTEDRLLGELYEQQTQLDARIKEREKFLQNVPADGMLVTDETTGETYKVFRPYKTSTTSVSVTLK